MTHEQLTEVITQWLRDQNVSICAHGLIPKSWEFEKDLAAHILEKAKEVITSHFNAPHDLEEK